MSAGILPSQLRLVGLAYGLAWLLHVDRLPAWCSLVAVAALGWRVLPHARASRLPPTAVRVVLAVALAGLTLTTARSLGGLAAGTALLVVMGAAKLLETRTRRDLWALIVVALFLTLAALLERQDLLRLPLYAGAAWFACAALASLGGSQAATRMRVALRESGTALAWALPFALLAFLFFPRIQGGLWGLPGSTRASTGLTDEMSPGSISDLSVSDAVAFRVHFEGTPPPPADRYWRGPVLHDFDGYTWRRGRGIAPRPQIEPLGEPVRYRVTLEPHGNAWWYALDTVYSSPTRRAMLTFDHQLLVTTPVTRLVSYEAVSHTHTRTTSPLSQVERRMDLRLDPQRNPRAQALARDWAARLESPEAIIAAALAYYRNQGFVYTLKPELLNLDSVDDFLFRTREGFCGHFASSFATLMRAAGIPARVVTGYQGGEWNDLGGYLLVRQSDAHAWVEVWLEGSGWQRVDPTAAAAPERLTRGFRDLMPEAGDAAARLVRGTPWLAKLLRTWDAANAWWQSSVIGFDQALQLRLLSRLGLPDADYRAMATLLGAGALAWLAVVLWLQYRRRPAPEDPAARAWQELQSMLAREGLGGPPHEAPAALAARVSAAAPGLTHALNEACSRYLALRYAPPVGDAAARRRALRDLGVAVSRVKAGLRQRRRELVWPLPDEARQDALRDMLWYYDALPPALRERTLRMAQRLQERVEFIGCNGLAVDDRMRTVISFQACLLVATRGPDLYDSLRSVLVYPDEFLVHERDEDEAGVVTEGHRTLSGQTIDDRRLVISWTDVERGLATADGYNVVVHEFAHFLDHVAGGALSNVEGGSDWHAVFDREYRRLCEEVDAGEDTLIDPYGAEDPVEFFAVCTEVFIELPWDLHEQHPELYAALRDFYGLDPVSWDPSPATAAALPG